MSESLLILKELIRLNSENPPGNTRSSIEWIEQWAKRNGIASKTQWYEKNQGNIILTVGNAVKTIVMCGHLDTVPVGNLNNWRYDPFGAEEKEGYIYGRGSADMKAGVAACLGALKSLITSANPDKLDFQIVFLGTSDEEVGLGGAKEAMKLGIMDKAKFLIVTEPTSLKVGIAEKGVLWFTIRSYGKAAHGSTPEKGINAIEALSKLFPILKDAVPQIIHPILGQSTLNIGTFKGGKSANVVPETAEVQCDFRLVPPISPMSFAQEMSSKIDDVGKKSPARFETEVTQIMAPISNSEKNEMIQLFMRESNNHTPIGLNYGTDAAIIITQAPHSVPFVIYGPGDPQAIHIANERVSIAEVLKAEKILSNFLSNVKDS